MVVERSGSEQPSNQKKEQSQEGSLHVLFGKSFKIEYHLLNPAPENVYMNEGEDYSKASDSDKKTFDQLLAGEYIYCLRVRAHQ